MRILITGAGGRVGQQLVRALALHTVFAFKHEELDIIDVRLLLSTVSRLMPRVVIHCAALTDTTLCEQDPDLAYRINGLGARNVAIACQRTGAAMCYTSTNEVFDGRKGEPYFEWDQPNPVNAYGRSKLVGEQYVRELLPAHYIVRTAWVYGHGSAKHFPAKVLKLAETTAELKMVTDEVATPTSAYDLADAIAKLVLEPFYGTYHLTNDGQCSRLEWAQEVLRLAKRQVRLTPIRLEEYAGGPPKPPYTVLRNFAAAVFPGVTLRPWQEALADFFKHGG